MRSNTNPNEYYIIKMKFLCLVHWPTLSFGYLNRNLRVIYLIYFSYFSFVSIIVHTYVCIYMCMYVWFHNFCGWWHLCACAACLFSFFEYYVVSKIGLFDSRSHLLYFFGTFFSSVLREKGVGAHILLAAWVGDFLCYSKLLRVCLFCLKKAWCFLLKINMILIWYRSKNFFFNFSTSTVISKLFSESLGVELPNNSFHRHLRRYNYILGYLLTPTGFNLNFKN